ncbi:MAG TPA: hypothetical protein VFG86_05030 [Chloroflexota bacterium]|jgi:hypothetical protein|nr:hypothetical protein [Chloroflexota bacterium]
MTQLDELLAQWARSHQLTYAQSEQIRGAIVRSEGQQDEDWLYDLLRPVTALLDGPHNLYDTLSQGYLKLAY